MQHIYACTGLLLFVLSLPPPTSLIQTPLRIKLLHRVRLLSRFTWQLLHQSPKDVRQTVRLCISKDSLKKRNKPKTNKKSPNLIEKYFVSQLPQMSVAYLLITLILIYLLLLHYVSWRAASSHEHPTDMDEVPVCVASHLTALRAKSKLGSTREICSRKELFFSS